MIYCRGVRYLYVENMSIGTKSMLFGVHAFWVHPIVVFIAWLKHYRQFPNWPELVAIIFHDYYWGLPNIDGREGKRHPILGATLAGRFGGRRARSLALGHSRSFSQLIKCPVSRLCAPDKLSILIEPRWFYLLRAKLSGEAQEFRQRSIESGEIVPTATIEDWYSTYIKSIKDRYEQD